MKKSQSSNVDTSIRVKSETRNKLVEIGRKNESYDSLLKRLIEHYIQNPPPDEKK